MTFQLPTTFEPPICIRLAKLGISAAGDLYWECPTSDGLWQLKRGNVEIPGNDPGIRRIKAYELIDLFGMDNAQKFGSIVIHACDDKSCGARGFAHGLLDCYMGGGNWRVEVERALSAIGF